MLDMINLLPVLRDEIVSASDVRNRTNAERMNGLKNWILLKYFQMGKGWLTEDEVQDLREWTFDIDVDDPRFLTEYS